MEKLDDPAVQSWFKMQGGYTRSVLTKIPGRDRLLARVRELDQTLPQIWGGRLPGDIYLLNKQMPGENVFKIYKRNGLNGQDILLVDPENVTLAPAAQSKGKNAIWGYTPSHDNKYLAVCIIPGGSELDGELHVFDMATGREIGDIITRIGAEAWEASWLPDNRSFVYGHIQQLPPGAPESEVRQKFRAYLHILGTDSAKDKQVFGYGVVRSINVDPSQISSISQAKMVGAARKYFAVAAMLAQHEKLNNRLRAQRRTVEASGNRAGSLQYGAACSAVSPFAIRSHACCRQQRP
jgi:prolyl oligopeptidase